MKALCEYDGGKCSQCGKKLPAGLHRTCKSWKALQPEYVPSEPKPPCQFLGPKTGEFRKKCCNCTPNIPEHFCLSPDRAVKKRDGTLTPGRCTPTGTCHDKAAGIQDCGECRFREAQLLIDLRIG